MAASQVFPTKWHFLAATVLFGVDSRTDTLLLGAEHGEAIWVCWTDHALAEHQIPDGYVLRQGPARQFLPLLPEGTGVRVDPGRERGVAFGGDMLAELVSLCPPFPAGHSADVGPLAVPTDLKTAFESILSANSFISAIWFFKFRIESGPAQGCAAYQVASVSADVDETSRDAMTAALDAALAGTELDEAPAGVHVMASGDLPRAIVRWLEGIKPVTAR